MQLHMAKATSKYDASKSGWGSEFSDSYIVISKKMYELSSFNKGGIYK